MCGGDKIHGILKELTLNAGWRDPRRVTIYSVHPNPPLHLPLPFIVEPSYFGNYIVDAEIRGLFTKLVYKTLVVGIPSTVGML